ncbi:MAG: 4-hydroxybenzoate octaprenyltransferase [Alphaproteobacteria bacterium]|nr:4-hydroxybenzoate octaprenyltransferase [Alphaproteobacteria bacterium]
MTDASKQGETIADALPGHWAERLLPPFFLPYGRLARLERPIGWWLLLLPCWWGLLLAQIAQGGGLPDLWFALLFFIGAVLMRGAGCTLNDIVDRDFDGRVLRTRQRPIAAGQVSVASALLFLALLSLAGLAVLLQFNRYTVLLGASSLVLVAIYPFMKRVTYWPQFFLGLAFNWGALVGWSAVHGQLALAPLLLYAGGILWTLAYDTIYAHQDMEDDLLVGIKSTALKFGDKSKPWIASFFAAALALIALSFWLAGAGLLAHIGVACAALHAAWQVARFEAGNAALALALFRSNRDLGLIIAVFLLLDCLIR